MKNRKNKQVEKEHASDDEGETFEVEVSGEEADSASKEMVVQPIITSEEIAK